MQGESSFQTPMSLAQDIPANEELGRGFRVRKAAAIVGPPYTQQGSTTPIPKKAKGRGRGKGAGPSMDDAAAYAGFQMLNKLFTTGTLGLMRLSCYPTCTVNYDWWGILLGHFQTGCLLEAVSSHLLCNDLCFVYSTLMFCFILDM